MLRLLFLTCAALGPAVSAAQAEGIAGAPQMSGPISSPGVANTSPIVLPNTAHTLLAETRGTEPPQQFDLTPVKLPERGSAFAPMQNLRTGVLYYLPAKMFLDVSCENSLRLETNVLQRRQNIRTDAVYRVFPNVTLGYALNRTTRISTNFFYFRDQYFNNSRLSRNIASLGIQGAKDFQITPKTTFTTTLFARELFITHSHSLVDVIPGGTLFRRVGRSGGVYASVLGQLRWANFLKRFQEGDQFYSLGALYRTPNWTFVWDNTLIDNFGAPGLRGGVATNHQIIMSMEAARKVSSRLPVVAFVRAQPIFNIGQETRQGFAGFNFRLFGGIRAEVSKPAIFPVKLGSG
jgi:hypothetical protein